MSLTLRFGSPATSWLTQASLLLKLWHSCPVLGELESSHVISIQFTRALSLASQIHWRIHDSSLMFAHASFSMFSLNKIIAHPAACSPFTVPAGFHMGVPDTQGSSAQTLVRRWKPRSLRLCLAHWAVRCIMKQYWKILKEGWCWDNYLDIISIYNDITKSGPALYDQVLWRRDQGFESSAIAGIYLASLLILPRAK